MIEIYKKLPKTNCGKCGSSTCMAFAMRVKKAQADLSDCPYVEDGTYNMTQTNPPTASQGGYEHVAEDIEKEAACCDFRQAAEAIGGAYVSCGGKEAIRLKMINKTYELFKEGLFENGEYSRDSCARIIICDYIRRQATKSHTGEWIGLGHFPKTASHVKAFQSNAEKIITAMLINDAARLKQRCAELGGAEAPNKLKADYGWRFDLLPHVPLFLFCWSADEEFGVDCKLLFDSSAEAYIDIEYLANLLERFTAELAGDQ